MSVTAETFADRAWGRIVGYVDRLGYLICVRCLGDDEPPLYDATSTAPIRARVGPHNTDRCERCGRIVNSEEPS
jgi:hypothetical protein